MKAKKTFNIMYKKFSFFFHHLLRSIKHLQWLMPLPHFFINWENSQSTPLPFKYVSLFCSCDSWITGGRPTAPTMFTVSNQCTAAKSQAIIPSTLCITVSGFHYHSSVSTKTSKTRIHRFSGA